MGNHSGVNSFADKSLKKLTSLILIAGILVVSGAIIYTFFQPEEEYAQFFILNEDKELGNYPTNISVGEPVEFHLLVENHFAVQKEFLIKIYKGNNQTEISTSFGCNITSVLEIPTTLNKGDSWISPMQTLTFEGIGDQQLIIAELWEKKDQNYIFIENLILLLRIDVLSS